MLYNLVCIWNCKEN